MDATEEGLTWSEAIRAMQSIFPHNEALFDRAQ